jgi:dihydrofolate reductase
MNIFSIQATICLDYPLKAKTLITKCNTRIYNGPIKDLVLKLESQAGKKGFCDGGVQVVQGLLKERRVGEHIISIIPMLLGDGIPLFQNRSPE